MEYKTDTRSIIAEYYERTFDTLVRQTTLRAGDQQTAEDIVQEAFTRLLTTCDTVMPQTLPAFINRIITNIIFDKWRKAGHAETYCKAMTVNDFDFNQTYRAIEAANILTIVKKEIERLDCESAKICTMSMLQEMKVAEIANELDIKYKKVENKLYGARKAIRGRLKGVI